MANEMETTTYDSGFRVRAFNVQSLARHFAESWVPSEIMDPSSLEETEEILKLDMYQHTFSLPWQIRSDVGQWGPMLEPMETMMV